MSKWVESAERTPDQIGEVWVVVIRDLTLLHRGRRAEMAEYAGEGWFSLMERDEDVFGDEIDWWMPLNRPAPPGEAKSDG